MALFLIKDTDATHLDPVKDRRGCYKRGDIIEVYADWQHGHCTGGHAGTHPSTPAAQRANPDCQTLGTWVSDQTDLATDPICPPFYLVRVSGLALADALPYVTPEASVGANGRLTIVTRRLYRLRVDDLPSVFQTALGTARYLAVPWTGVQGVGRFVRNKATGQDAA